MKRMNKMAICLAAGLLYVSLSTKSVLAKGRELSAEQGIAGIAYTLDNYYQNVQNKHDGSADKALSKILKTDIISPYKNLGVSIANNYVNIRKEPSTDSDVVGKVYRGSAADILEYLENDWVKIKSGDVDGYIAANYLAIGKSAEAMVDEYATKYATIVGTKTLRVRAEASKEAATLELIPEGETYIVIKEHDEWAEILYGSDEEGNDLTGYISKDYANITVEFKYAISIEEENRILREQQEAERAEAERKRMLEAEEAAKKAEAERLKKEAEAKKAAEAQKQATSNSNNSSSSSSSNTSKETTSSKPSTSSSSKSGSEIAKYALNFVGNPYVWGGTSLTRGADCSGFVQTIYSQFGYSIPRDSRSQAAGAGYEVSLSDRQPGDLLFYASGGRVNHVAMYIGNDRIVHAANRRQGIITSRYNYRDVYKIRRVVR